MDAHRPEPEENWQNRQFEILPPSEKEEPKEQGIIEVDERKRAGEILEGELSSYYWDIITKENQVGAQTFKEWIIDAMLEFKGREMKK